MPLRAYSLSASRTRGEVRAGESCWNREGAFTQKQIELWNEELQWLRQNRREHAAGNPAFEYGCLNAWSEDGVFSEAEFADSLYRHLRNLQEQAAMEREDPVAELERHLREHYASFQTIDELAKLFHMHPLHLSRLFRKKYHIGIKEFVQKLRIEHAKNLLHQSDLRIGVISAMVGYQDEKYFSRVFRQAVGVSPNQYRQ
ncbi:helix-turn-helix domain-containing protein [Paenibacillus chungangensis]|uniref:Helix-turn-helix domain-containing protein n=1 Tax=Paenibacillus chungangensis TaxID=696535 RepID=A0ABW3HU60_9BACL